MQEATKVANPVEEIAAAWRRERPGTPVDSIGVVTRIWRLAKLFGEDRRRVLAEAGVDASTLDLLSTLRRAGAPYVLTTREIAERTMVTAGAVSQRIARAERDGLVVRHPAERGTRAVRVELTADGHATVEATVDHVLGSEMELLTGLSDEERDQLAALLQKLLADLQGRLGEGQVTHVGT